MKPGQHIVTKKQHPAAVLVSAMAAAGVPAGKLGDVQGGVDELFVAPI